MPRRINIEDFIGKKYHFLTILKEVPHIAPSRFSVLAKCDCGKEKKIRIGDILSGKTQSCGCYHKNVASKSNSTHKLCKHPLYIVWRGMIQRCYDPNFSSYYRYGARNVIMCDEWKNDFVSFFKWATENGWRRGLQIDKDIKAAKSGVDGMIYSPEMCSVVTPKINNQQKSVSVMVTYNNETKSIPEWADIFSIKRKLLYQRIVTYKWDIPRAFGIANNFIPHSFGYIN